MTRVKAAITVSLDGYITGPNDGPDKGLGEGGEALHSWVFGGPWTYESGPKGEATGVDKEYLDEGMRSQGAAIVGRNMYEAAGHWGDRNPWEVPTFILTHRPEEQPDGDEFTFVGSLDEALSRAREAAGARTSTSRAVPTSSARPWRPMSSTSCPSSSRPSCWVGGSACSRGSSGASSSSSWASASRGSPRSSTIG